MADKKQIILVEPVLNGHRITYLRYFAETFLKQGYRVHILAPENKELCYWLSGKNLEYLNHHLFELNKTTYTVLNTFRNSLNCWKQVGKFIRNNKFEPDLVILMSMDTFNASVHSSLKPAGLPIYMLLNRMVPLAVKHYLPYAWAGMYVGANPNVCHVFMADNNIAIGVLEEGFQFCNQRLNSKIISIPDITDTNLGESRSRFENEVSERAVGRKVISLLGRIHSRKGVRTFLKTAELLKDDRRYFFVLAGEPVFESFTEDEKGTLNQLTKGNQENIAVFAERINDGHDFNSIIRCSDVLFAAYPNFTHSSNLLTKAAYFKKPIIVTEKTYMASVVEKYKLGISVRKKSPEDVIRAINELTRSLEVDEKLFDEYFRKNSPEAVDEAVRNIEKLMEL